MADKKITDLPVLTTADASDPLPIVDASGNITAQTTPAGLAPAVAANLPSGAIGAEELSTDAIFLDYAERTSSFSTTSSTPVQITDLSLNITIPAGGRRVRVTVHGRSLLNSTANRYTQLTIWLGTVGSGTKIGGSSFLCPIANGEVPIDSVTIPTLDAGSYTINAALNIAGGSSTGSFNAASNGESAFILAELI